MKHIIHVNQHVIRKNQKTGERSPVLTVKSYKDNQYAHEVRIDGPCVIRYSPDSPLSCGARVWIETDSPVSVSAQNAGTCETKSEQPDSNSVDPPAPDARTTDGRRRKSPSS